MTGSFCPRSTILCECVNRHNKPGNIIIASEGVTPGHYPRKHAIDSGALRVAPQEWPVCSGPAGDNIMDGGHVPYVQEMNGGGSPRSEGPGDRGKTNTVPGCCARKPRRSCGGRTVRRTPRRGCGREAAAAAARPSNRSARRVRTAGTVWRTGGGGTTGPAPAAGWPSNRLAPGTSIQSSGPPRPRCVYARAPPSVPVEHGTVDAEGAPQPDLTPPSKRASRPLVSNATPSPTASQSAAPGSLRNKKKKLIIFRVPLSKRARRVCVRVVFFNRFFTCRIFIIISNCNRVVVADPYDRNRQRCCSKATVAVSSCSSRKYSPTTRTPTTNTTSKVSVTFDRY